MWFSICFHLQVCRWHNHHKCVDDIWKNCCFCEVTSTHAWDVFIWNWESGLFHVCDETYWCTFTLHLSSKFVVGSLDASQQTCIWHFVWDSSLLTSIHTTYKVLVYNYFIFFCNVTGLSMHLSNLFVHAFGYHWFQLCVGVLDKGLNLEHVSSKFEYKWQ